MLIARYKHPKTKFKRVWVGMYGGHYDIIVFFKRKPKKSKEDYKLIDCIKGKYYDCYDNKDLIVGDMSLCDFEVLYPEVDLSPYLDNGRPKEIEITEVFQIKLEAVWDKYNTIEEYKMHIDW
jgi:hypothetical protein